ncbi:MAG: hypothetical protein A2156_03480 [Deltaproteobacteria bacterium RBG_16_48_10]|nr:MAG: hypothetical protein A2156_03480 [Deltaproteobacteria bacterium RBG_16_48_10]
MGLFLILGLLTSCATQPPIKKEEDEKGILQKRAEDYWQYQIKGDIEKAYQCEAPEFREKVSLIQYINRFKLVKYLEAKVSPIEINGDRGKVSVDITYKMLLQHISRKDLKKVVEEKWTRVNGVWYHIPE